MKLARNGAFGNKEVRKIVLDPEWKEMVPGHYQKNKSLFALFVDNNQIPKYCFCNHLPKSSFITMPHMTHKLCNICLDHIVYIGRDLAKDILPGTSPTS